MEKNCKSIAHFVLCTVFMLTSQHFTFSQQIASGADHNLLIKKDGSLWGWGWNTSGQVGDGSGEHHPRPIPIGSANDWASVAAGELYSLAIKNDGTLWAWGENEFGQLGDGTNEDRLTPVQIGVDNNWTAVSAGTAHTLALKTDGSLWAWGRNEYGEVGDGSTENKPEPVQVGTDTDWISISAGRNHSLAIKSNGTLWVWGDNRNNFLGLGFNTDCLVESITNPTGDYVLTLNDSYGDGWNGAILTAILDGERSDYTLAIGSTETVTISVPDGTSSLSFEYSAGDWESEVTYIIQAPNGNFIAEYGPSPKVGVVPLYICDEPIIRAISSPVMINNDADWVSISAGASYSHAIKSDGSLWAWGSNSTKQLGDGTDEDKFVPVQIAPTADWLKVESGFEHTMAVKQDGTIWAWGRNTSGQLGIASSDNQSIPKQVGATGNWLDVSTGHAYSLAVATDGSLWEWGSNSLDADKLVPTKIGTGAEWGTFCAGSSTNFAFSSDGSLWAWGLNSLNQFGNGNTTSRPVPVKIGLPQEWLEVSTKRNHTIALKSDGTIWTWGWNSYGQIGDGTTTDRSSPVQVGANADWTRIFAGHYSTFAQKADGTLWAWGRNFRGALGDGTVEDRLLPVQIGSDTDWVSISGGQSHVLALKSDGTLWSWGGNFKGQTGDGTTMDKHAPSQVGSNTDWKIISAGPNYSVAIKSDGTLWSWGDNFHGQLGNGSNEDGLVPAQVGSDADWAKISAGYYHVLALKEDGSIWAWGNNIGQLGDGTKENKNSPIKIGSDLDWNLIGAGSTHSIATKTDGTLWAWGQNYYGQLGDGSAWRESPQMVKTTMDILLSIGQQAGDPTSVGAFSVVNESSEYTPSLSLATGEGDTDNGSFAIEGKNLVVTGTIDLSTKSDFSIRVKAEDSFGNNFSKSFTFSLANSAPTALALDAASLKENAAKETKVGTFTTTDPDQGDTHTYSLVAGEGDTDNASFAISGSELLSNAIFDFETKSSYKIRVQTKDALGATFSQAFTVTITDENDLPTDIALSSSVITEQLIGGKEVGGLSTADQDASDTHTYILLAGEGDADNALFSIAGSKLVTAEGIAANVKDTYSVRIQSEDSKGGKFSKAFTITTSNLKKTQTVTFSLPESLYPDQSPFTLTASATSELPVTFELVSGPATLDGSQLTLTGTGEVTIKAVQVGNETYLPASSSKATQSKAYLTLTVSANKTEAEVLAAGTGKLFTEQGVLVTQASVAEGSLQLDGLKHGAYRLQIIPASAEAQEVNATYYPSVLNFSQSETITLTQNTSLSMTMVAKAQEVVSGSGVISGKVLQADGEGGRIVVGKMLDGVGVQDVPVFLLDAATDAVVRSAITDATGGFRMTGLGSGTYKLQLEVAGFQLAPGSDSFEFDETQGELDISAVLGEDGTIGIVYEIVAGVVHEPNTICIYPNPVMEFVTISATKPFHALQIFSIDGQKLATKFTVVSDRQVSADVTELKKGVYLMQLIFEDGIVTRKFVKQ